MAKVRDDDFQYMESDIEKIQAKPNMYVSYTGQRGSLHLWREAVNNAIDEDSNAYSPGNLVDLFVDQTENIAIVSDNGRGFPFEHMIKACTMLQSGSKMTRSGGGKASAGENGVGLTAINALSEHFEIISHRQTEQGRVLFKDGKLKEDLKVIPIKKKKHGTDFIFKPSAFYLDKENETCAFPIAAMQGWISKIAYCVPEHIKIRFQAKLIGKESAIDVTYKNEGGMAAYVQTMSKKQRLEPVSITGTVFKQQTVRGETYDRELTLDLAFTYDNLSTRTDNLVESFCNYVETIDGGSHVETVETTLTNILRKHAKKALTEREAKNIDIIKSDIMSGLDVALCVSTNINPEFSGQTKEKVTSESIIQPIKDVINEHVEKYFVENPKVLKRLTDIIKMNAKARIASEKTRETIIKPEKVSVLDEHRIPHFSPALNKTKHGYRELILMEGESAAGSVNGVRFKEFQATYGLRGYIPNSFASKVEMITKNTQLRALITLMRAGFGKNFELEKAYYEKVVILTDGDSDGFYIETLIAGFMLLYMRPFVEAGMLYRALPPLYRIKDKDHEFIRNKREYVKVFEARIVEHMNLSHPKSGEVLSDEALEGFLFVNRVYLEELDRVSTYYATHHDVMEFVAMYGLEKDFEDRLVDHFKELEYDKENGILSGIYEGRYQNLLIQKQLNKKLAKIRRILNDGNGGFFVYGVQRINKDGSITDLGKMTIGQFMRSCEKYSPQIISRYKGLGEIRPEDLRDTTLDPNNRTLIQLTVEDLEKELEFFEIIQGNSTEAKRKRKELVRAFDIDLDDLDN